MNDTNLSDFEYLYIGNIPSTCRSADLRWFFQDFVEKCAFKCFHYRHRPEKQVVLNKITENNFTPELTDTSSDTCCCIINIFVDYTAEFIKKYNGKEWRNKKLEFLKRTVVLRRISAQLKPVSEESYLTKRSKKAMKHVGSQELYLEDMNCSIELNPPEFVMPNGNVGTSTTHFLKLIKDCKMPSSLIKSLSLEFPMKSDGIYSNVPPHYDDCTARNAYNHDTIENHFIYKTERNKLDESEITPEAYTHHTEDDEAEDWERHLALHDNVDNQSRPKERLFEEDIELKWEKGGSGLVFYTDSYFWNEMKGKDFDEDTIDDWDVDYSVYYEDGAGDKPAKDQLKMCLEKRRREGKEDGLTKPSHLRRKENNERKYMKTNFAAFEKYNKGFGSRILKKQGWTEGCGVGLSSKGITEPLDPYGQKPHDRVGLGYYGEKINHAHLLKSKTSKYVYISSKYDTKYEEHENAMRSNGLDCLKYRS